MLILQKTAKQDSPECVYWDNNIREWSYKGCFRRAMKEDFVICVCNHLSRFAVILVSFFFFFTSPIMSIIKY